MSPESTEVLQSLFQGVEGKLQSMLQVRKTQVLQGKSRVSRKHRKQIAKMSDDLEKEKARRDELTLPFVGSMPLVPVCSHL